MLKKIWNGFLREALFLYCGIFTAATLINSVIELAQGIREDPAGNWHELDRAFIALIIVVACMLIRKLKMKNIFLKALMIYAPTMLLVFGFVWFNGEFIEELAPTAYRDIFINYTIGFTLVTIVDFVIARAVKKSRERKSDSQ